MAGSTTNNGPYPEDAEYSQYVDSHDPHSKSFQFINPAPFTDMSTAEQSALGPNYYTTHNRGYVTPGTEFTPSTPALKYGPETGLSGHLPPSIPGRRQDTDAQSYGSLTQQPSYGPPAMTYLLGNGYIPDVGTNVFPLNNGPETDFLGISPSPFPEQQYSTSAHHHGGSAQAPSYGSSATFDQSTQIAPGPAIGQGHSPYIDQVRSQRANWSKEEHNLLLFIMKQHLPEIYRGEYSARPGVWSQIHKEWLEASDNTFSRWSADDCRFHYYHYRSAHLGEVPRSPPSIHWDTNHVKYMESIVGNHRNFTGRIVDWKGVKADCDHHFGPGEFVYTAPQCKHKSQKEAQKRKRHQFGHQH